VTATRGVGGDRFNVKQGSWEDLGLLIGGLFGSFILGFM